MQPLHRLPLGILALTAPLHAQVTVDGSIVADSYGGALAVQTVNTQFGDNASEINAAYATIAGGRLYLAFTGNIEDNFNKFEIFIDSAAGGENVFSGTPGNDGSGAMTGLTFDSGFDADYHLIVRRGFFGTPLFDLDMSVLGTANVSTHGDIFGGASTGAGTTGTGPANASPIEVAYDGSNVAGIVGGDTAADSSAALAVTTGLELSIALTDLGNPSADIKVLVFQNNDGHNYASNQFLGGLSAPQGNLGGDGFGNFTGSLNFDLNTFGGDQFFVVPNPLGSSYCSASANSSGAAALISALGSRSLAANDLTLTASLVPDEFGLFYYGTSQSSTPFGNGTRCVTGTTSRLDPPLPSAGGTAVRVVDLVAQGIAPGTLYFQYWFRDPNAGGAFFDLSNGFSIDFVP